MGGRPRIDGLGREATAFDEAEALEARPGSAARDPEAPPPAPPARGTDGTLRSGMGIPEVVTLLGEPDIVTRGPGGREVWLWDAVSSRLVDMRPTAAIPGLLTGGDVAGTDGESVFTVMVRFDELQQVSSVSVLACRR